MDNGEGKTQDQGKMNKRGQRSGKKTDAQVLYNVSLGSHNPSILYHPLCKATNNPDVTSLNQYE